VRLAGRLGSFMSPSEFSDNEKPACAGWIA
jgi:hypothetical protein